MSEYRLPFDTPGTERKVGKILVTLFGVVLFFGGFWMGYESAYFMIKGKQVHATVTKTHYFNRGFDISYSYENTGSTKEGGDHMYGLEHIPKAGEVINIFVLADGRTLYITIIDDFLIPILGILFGGIILSSIIKKKGVK